MFLGSLHIGGKVPPMAVIHGSIEIEINGVLFGSYPYFGMIRHVSVEKALIHP